MFSCHGPISGKNLSYSNSTAFFSYPEGKRLEGHGVVPKPIINEACDGDSEYALPDGTDGGAWC